MVAEYLTELPPKKELESVYIGLTKRQRKL